jgi:hypothetical protein
MSLDELITLATYEKAPVGTINEKTNRVPGKTIEVYIVRGDMPKHYLNEDNDMETQLGQIQIIAYYTDKDGKREGVTLYRKEDEGHLKFFTSKKVFGRALGRGVGESILHDQIWTNFLAIHKHQLLEAAAKVPLYTDDPAYSVRNKIQDMENLEITTIEEGKRIFQVPTAAPTNIQLYEADINGWFEHAQFQGAAFDPLLGKEPPSGTTFRGQERTVAQGRGAHDRRRGQRAKFIEEIYRDWIIPDIKKEITRGRKFLATLDTDDLMWFTEQLTENLVNKRVNDAILDGRLVTNEEKEILKQAIKGQILKKGNKQVLNIVKDALKDTDVKLSINIAGKQKDLVNLSDKLLSIFQFIFANPQGFQAAMQIPALAKSFENILEFSGMSIADFSSLLKAPEIQPQTGQQGQPTQPAPLALNNA